MLSIFVSASTKVPSSTMSAMRRAVGMRKWWLQRRQT